MLVILTINSILLGYLLYREIKYGKIEYPYFVIRDGTHKGNCSIYAFKPDCQPNFVTVELCDGQLESMVLKEETKLCVKRIIYVSSEITVREVGEC